MSHSAPRALEPSQHRHWPRHRFAVCGPLTGVARLGSRRLLVAYGATSSDLTAVVLGHGLELRVNPFVLRRLWGPAGNEVQQFLGLVRAGLRANADQARLVARLRATER